MRLAIKIVTGFILLGFIGSCLYFVGGISATYPPIRKYDCNGDVEQFGSSIQRLAQADSSIKLKISRRGINRNDDGNRDMVLVIKKDTVHIIYILVCKETFNGKGASEINLVETSSGDHKVGGYRIEHAGVKEFLNFFEKDFLNKLEKQQGIILNQDKSFFGNFSLY